VDFARELDPGWVADATTVGVTSGASVPEELVTEVLDWLAEQGIRELEEVSAAQERLVFALPPELRRDMRATGS
jgi:4-hydroxy-3-methylbut-2-enyl diphosphate reductase